MCALYLYSTSLAIQVRNIRPALLQCRIWLALQIQNELLHLVEPQIYANSFYCMKWSVRIC